MRLVDRVKGIRRELQYHFKFGRRLKSMHRLGKKAFVCVGSAVHGNMGDQALGHCRITFLNQAGVSNENIIEYTTRDKMRYWPQICSSLKKSDVIILRGGGCWGDLWLDGFEEILSYIETFSDNRLLVFPQSVFFTETERGQSILEKSQQIINKASRLTICARDVNSQKLLLQYYPNCDIVVTPDTVLSYKPLLDIKQKREGVLVCLRNDKEKNRDINVEKMIYGTLNEQNIKIIEQDTCIDFNMQDIRERELRLNEMWKTFASAQIVITDRLHGMIFATITGTPCIVFDNIDGKVRNQYEWIKSLGYVYYMTDEKKFSEVLEKCLQMKNVQYPVDEILAYYKSLEDVIKNL